jgi:DNA-binding NarL/FixJ family response regulator
VPSVGSGAEALAEISDRLPDVLVLDVSMPGMCGYEVCRSVRIDLGLDLPILFVSGERTDPLDRVAGLTLGGDDYLVKPFSLDELLARVRCLLRRSTVVASTPTAGLSRRELEVLRLLAEGLGQAEIAERLVISPKTVSTHIERILAKLGAHSRAEAVALAYRLQLVPVPA